MSGTVKDILKRIESDRLVSLKYDEKQLLARTIRALEAELARQKEDAHQAVLMEESAIDRAEKAEANAAHAKAAHLNCAVVKRDLTKAEADLAAARQIMPFVHAMREAMVRHHERVPSDSMEPWNQHKPVLLRKALVREFNEWEDTLVHGGNEEKELVDVANCSYFVWRSILQPPGGRESGEGIRDGPGALRQADAGTSNAAANPPGIASETPLDEATARLLRRIERDERGAE